jgi:hypothetical protein
MDLKINMNNLGRCYELAFKYLISHSDWELVHGYITNKFPPFQTIDHAWCMKDGVIHDEIFETDFDEIVYKALFDFQIVKEYNYEEAMKKNEESNGHVMWHEIPKSESDKYYDDTGNLKGEYKFNKKMGRNNNEE